MKFRVSSLNLMEKVNNIIKDLIIINNNNPYNMIINIKDKNGNSFENGDNYCCYVSVEFNEIEEKLDKKNLLLYEIKNIKPLKASEIFIVKDKKKELLELFEKHKCGKCALNFYEKGSVIEFMVSMDDYNQFDNIEVTCPGINNQILTIGKKYHIFSLREKKLENHIKYEKLLNIKKVENSTEYEFYFENIKEPFITYTRKNINDTQEIIHRFDYIIFDYFKGDFIKNSLQLINNNISILETKKDIKNNSKYYKLIEMILNKRIEWKL